MIGGTNGPCRLVPERKETPSRRAQRSRAFRRLQKRLGARIRSLRQVRGWTLQETEAHSDVDWKHLAKIEHAESNPTLATLYRLAKGFGVDIAELFNDESGDR